MDVTERVTGCARPDQTRPDQNHSFTSRLLAGSVDDSSRLAAVDAGRARFDSQPFVTFASLGGAS